MVTNITSLTGNGLKDWLIQRATAIYFALYSIFILGLIVLHPHTTYMQWQCLFHSVYFQISTAIALITLILHAWIGIWTVSTDYIKCTALRLSLQLLVALFLMAQLIWGLMMVWGR